MGDALFSNGSYSESISHYQRSLSLVPDQPIVEVRLGRAYARLDKPQLAESTIEAACQKRNPFPDCYLELATLRNRLNNYTGAVDATNKAIPILTFPRLDEALRQQAYALTQLKRYPEAFRAIERATKINPRSCWIRATRGWMEVESKNFEQPESHFRQAREACASQTIFYEWEAWGLLRIGRRADATRVYQMLINSFRDPAVQERARLNIEKIENRIPVDRPDLI